MISKGQIVMGTLAIPSEDLLMALGALMIAHTHLELILRYTVKTLSGLSISDALDATSQDRATDLRTRVKHLFKDKKPTATEKCQLDALLTRAKRLTEKRNAYLHSVWSTTPEGKGLMKGEDHSWGPAPTQKEVGAVMADLILLAQELNHDRLRGVHR